MSGRGSCPGTLANRRWTVEGGAASQEDESGSDPPPWLQPAVEAAGRAQAHRWSRHRPPTGTSGRRSAVLILFGESRSSSGEPVPDLLLIERAHTLRSHAGQPAFPGGAVDPTDDGPVAAALREAREETGVNPAGVEVLATLPELWLPPSGFLVTPVLAWWRRPTPVRVVDTAEVASVHRVPLAELVDPANRLRARHPSGYLGPAFRVSGLLVWGFTAGVLDALLEEAGMALPWDRSRVEPVPLALTDGVEAPWSLG